MSAGHATTIVSIFTHRIFEPTEIYQMLDEKLASEIDVAEAKAIDSLARYKFAMFGYWLYTTHLILSVFIVYYIWIPFRAIGEYQQRFAIEEEAKLLKKVENLKQNFISLMSHDLKTPMAKINGIAENMLQRGPADPNFDRNLDSIITSTSDLNNFISSILDFDILAIFFFISPWFIGSFPR